ncbi:MAG: hypothetical protein HKP61_08850 [Dactylosporangium sp.]|nr:hypothetical protein [Dactylosporangium sp.]NNJ61043.1 hypothetical protein [Dactylosporangium sp.]
MTERELGAFLAGFRETAFRFETRDRYNSDVGREAFRKFMAGEPDDYAWHRSWLEMLRRDRRQGKRWRRVRTVTLPLSDWARYGLEIARLSVQAGDDIRYMPRDLAKRLDFRPYDAWLFDETLLVHLHFDDNDDTFTGAEVITDTEVVRRHQAWRDLAWRHAQTLDDFVASLS